MSKKAIEWRDCPICGGKMIWEGEEWESYFLCTECGYSPNFEGCETLEQAVEWWNKRPLEDQLRARIAHLEQNIEKAKEILEEDMGEWLPVEPLYMPDHVRAMKHAWNALSEEVSKVGEK